MTRTITIQTTHGDLEFSLSGQNMTVLNCNTGEMLCSGDPDQPIVNAMEDDYDDEYAARVGQEWADNFYGEEV